MSQAPAVAAESAGRPGRAVARATTWVLIVAGLVYGLTLGGGLTTTDARYILDVSRNIVEHGSVALSPELSDRESNRGVDGRYYSQYGLGHSIYGIPFYLAGRSIDRVAGSRVGRPQAFAKATFGLGSAVAAAASVALCFLFAWQLTGNGRAALYAALAAGFGSPLWPYSGFGFNATLATLALVGACLTAWIGATHNRAGAMVTAGLLLGFGWLTRHEQVLAVLPVGAFLLLQHRGRPRRLLRDVALLSPGLLGAAVLLAIYNRTRFGSPVEFGYAPEFSLAGFWGFTLSPGGSLVLYAPIVLVALAGLWLMWRERALAPVVLVGGQFVLFFVFFASLDDWPGGRAYGPRYLVPAVALVCVVTSAVHVRASAGWRRILLAALVVSSVLQLPGVLVDYSRVSRGDVPLREQHDRLATSAFGACAVAAVDAVPRNARYMLGLESPPSVSRSGGDEFHERLAFSLDFWWAYLFYLHVIPRWVALAVPLVGTMALVVAVLRLRACVAVLSSAAGDGGS